MKWQPWPLVSFGLVSACSILVGWLFPMGAWTEQFIMLIGYTSVAVCAGFFLYTVYLEGRPLKGSIDAFRTRGVVGPLVAVLAATLWLLSIEPFMFKVVNDEILIAANSQGMHLARAPGIAQSGNWSNGHYVLLESFLDKRPFLLPFLVSVVHDLTGYRLGNVFVVNALLTFAFLSVGFTICARVAGRPAGYFFLVLLAFFPVLAQGATGGNASVLNATLIVVSIYLAMRYWEQPEKRTLVPFVYAVLLLAQARYESAVYILPFGIVILMGWRKAGRAIVPLSVILAPLFLVINLIHQRYTLKFDNFYWQAGPTDGRSATFSFGYLPDNLQATWDFLFTLGHNLPNSIILTVIGLAGLILVLFALLKKDLPENTVFLAGLVLALFLINSAIVLFFNYGLFTYQSTSRLSMPMHVFLALFGVLAFHHRPRQLLQAAIVVFIVACVLQTLSYSGFDWRQKGLYILICIVGATGLTAGLLSKKNLSPHLMTLSLLVLSLAVMSPKLRSMDYLYDYVYNRKVHFYLDFVENHQGEDVLFLCRTPFLPTLLMQNSLAPLDFISRQKEVTKALLEGHYRKVYFLHGKSMEEDKEPPVKIDNLKILLPDLDIGLCEQRRIGPGSMVYVHELSLKESVRQAAITDESSVQPSEEF